MPLPDGRPWQERELFDAIGSEQFVLRYQPIVDLPDGRMVAVEALVSWDHPEHGLVPPDEFIGVAERTGSIVELGDWVLNTACEQVRAWQLSVPALRHLRVAVNVSARQLTAALPGSVQAALDRSGLPADCLEIEVTESAFIFDLDGSLEVLGELGALGIGLSIDDFGTGFSSFSYLKRLPVTGLKIDKAFIDDLSDDPRDVSIVAAVVALSAALGLTQIAEGVETEEQRRKLEALGCAHAQGFLFSRPLAVDAFLDGVADLVGDDAPVAEPTGSSVPRVVICDDEDSIRRLYRRALQSCDVVLVDAVDAQDCLEKVAEVQPHLVVLDVTLPGRGGLDILAEVRELCPTARIVVISGLVTAETMTAAMILGAEACVGKMQFLPRLRSLVSSIVP